MVTLKCFFSLPIIYYHAYFYGKQNNNIRRQYGKGF